MKLYVVTCCEYEAYTNKYDKYVETIGVFIMKHFAEHKISQLHLENARCENDYEYYISEHEV